ncbi:hypothetical protein GCM10027422_35250 [Hymenobacter arcticus]
MLYKLNQGRLVADFQARLIQVAEAAAIEQFCLESTPKRFGVGIIVAVTAAAPALYGLVACY